MSEKKYQVACYFCVATKNRIDGAPLEGQSTRLRRDADNNALEVVGAR